MCPVLHHHNEVQQLITGCKLHSIIWVSLLCLLEAINNSHNLYRPGQFACFSPTPNAYRLDLGFVSVVRLTKRYQTTGGWGYFVLDTSWICTRPVATRPTRSSASTAKLHWYAALGPRMATFKTGSNKKTYDISCILISFTCDENLVKIRPFLRELSHFLCSGVSCYVRVLIYLVTRGSPVQISVESSTFFSFFFFCFLLLFLRAICFSNLTPIRFSGSPPGG